MEMGKGASDRAHHSLHGSIEETTIFLRSTKTTALNVKTTDTIKKIKSRYREMEALSEDPSEIRFAGKPLDDGRALLEHHIHTDSPLDVVILERPIPMHIFIKIISSSNNNNNNNKHVVVMIETSTTDTIHIVKVKIHKREGVPPERQVLLTRSGRKLEDGEKTLSAYDVTNGSTLLVLFRPREVGVRISVEEVQAGKVVAVDVKGWYTVGDVRAVAESMMGLLVPPSDENQRVVYDEVGRILPEEWSMEDCKVTTGMTLTMVPVVSSQVRCVVGETAKPSLWCW